MLKIVINLPAPAIVGKCSIDRFMKGVISTKKKIAPFTSPHVLIISVQVGILDRTEREKTE